MIFLGIVTDLTNVQDPFFVCEHTALDKLEAGLVEACRCGQMKWVASSHKQVFLRNQIEIARTFMHFYAYIRANFL